MPQAWQGARHAQTFISSPQMLPCGHWLPYGQGHCFPLSPASFLRLVELKQGLKCDSHSVCFAGAPHFLSSSFSRALLTSSQIFTRKAKP